MSQSLDSCFQLSFTISCRQLRSRSYDFSVYISCCDDFWENINTANLLTTWYSTKITANQAFYSSSVRIANERNVAGYRAVPVTNACHMTVTPMETVTRLKICSWIWKEKRPSVPTLFWYKMPPTLFQKLFNKRNAFSSPPPRCSKEDPAFR